MKKLTVFHPAVFLGAFLLFMVQPLIGKYLLPWFGGSPSVWTTCLLFFQTLLLGGYAYAHVLQRLQPGRQAATHILLLFTALAGAGFLFFKWGNPILPAPSLKPVVDASPAGSIFRLLLISIGPAYFLLSTSASLLQAWFHRVAPDRSAYFFYVISNTASLLALLCYPLLLEPFLTLKTQALIWSGGFVLYTVLCALCAFKVRSADNPPPSPHTMEAGPFSRRREYLYWTVCAACGVLMLMAATNQMTLDIPPIPFLWVLPLALYLLSYIIGFTDRLKQLQPLYILMLCISGAVAWYMLSEGVECIMPVQIVAHSFILFSVCLFCHQALYRSKPNPSQLTGFYLCIALGGVLGGLFVAVLAPRIFNHYWEYQIALVLAATLAALAAFQNPASLLYKVRFIGFPAVAILACAITYTPFMKNQYALYASRNFFGTLRVDQTNAEKGILNTLRHGRIDHGSQYLDATLAKSPTSYYTRESGIGLAFEALRSSSEYQPMRVGILGTGVGTLAAYGLTGDVFRLYEINPHVIALAENPLIFSYLKDSAATIQTVQGDGRIQLERELHQTGSQQFNLLVLDAFSGDSPPAHLFTQEAFELYLQHLAPDGILAVHISNRYINFCPLMRAIQQEFGLFALLIYDDDEGGLSAFETEWMIFSPSDKALSDELRAWDSFEDYPDVIPIWTDDYSNLLSLFW